MFLPDVTSQSRNPEIPIFSTFDQFLQSVFLPELAVYGKGPATTISDAYGWWNSGGPYVEAEAHDAPLFTKSAIS
jgi:hypothetical protein